MPPTRAPMKISASTMKSWIRMRVVAIISAIRFLFVFGGKDRDIFTSDICKKRKKNCKYRNFSLSLQHEHNLTYL